MSADTCLNVLFPLTLYIPQRFLLIMHSSRGQAFDVLKILVGAVIAVMLLIIAMGATGNITYPEYGAEATARIISQAVKAPGECFGSANVKFVKGEYSDLAQVSKHSVAITVNPAYSAMASGTGPTISITADFTAPVSVKCSTTCT